jgi:hypothetical protein
MGGETFREAPRVARKDPALTCSLRRAGSEAALTKGSVLAMLRCAGSIGVIASVGRIELAGLGDASRA